ncbi:glycine oxidase ThiO [Aureimonas sp. SA4125]|uniref:glycine oxidase ThiO n=1 Tax=Aureimonas sp. SA4125 TaxID=2826993 RepID=UPI001CC64748|nr:glycine oxidase ThiO [Aureimonas sp. SA4125]BDA85280.1 glycine oxidase ThiO [Aureimonas sp. SA4125]
MPGACRSLVLRQARHEGIGAIAIVGAGVAGLTTAVTLAERGMPVTLYDRTARLGQGAASWLAGGMLAPHCEAEKADASIVAPGLAAIEWWADRVPGVERRGTLVVALSRDAGEVARFARRTEGGELLDAAGLAAIEPDLAGRFAAGLFFADEAHLDPRTALEALAERFIALGGTLVMNAAVDPVHLAVGKGARVIDCRGSAAPDPALRHVRGEMLILHAPGVSLSRPVRLLHPRHPLYVVPRGKDVFMLGATEIESAAAGPITARSIMDLLNAAVALHPGFGEAAIIETGAGLRPAFPDNLPRIGRGAEGLSLNGLYRHGFLLAPSFAERIADEIRAAAGPRRVA